MPEGVGCSDRKAVKGLFLFVRPWPLEGQRWLKNYLPKKKKKKDHTPLLTGTLGSALSLETVFLNEISDKCQKQATHLRFQI